MGTMTNARRHAALWDVSLRTGRGAVRPWVFSHERPARGRAPVSALPGGSLRTVPPVLCDRVLGSPVSACESWSCAGGWLPPRHCAGREPRITSSGRRLAGQQALGPRLAVPVPSPGRVTQTAACTFQPRRLQDCGHRAGILILGDPQLHFGGEVSPLRQVPCYGLNCVPQIQMTLSSSE